MTPDLTGETDHEKIARRAMAVVADMRDIDPQQTLDTLAIMCGTEPVRMAQVIMALAIWVDLDATTQALWRRAEAVARAVA